MLIRSLAQDAQELTSLRVLLASHVMNARKFVDSPDFRFRSPEGIASAKEAIKSLDADIEKAISQLDQTVRDLLQLVRRPKNLVQ